MLAAQVIGVSPADNPDRIQVQVAFSGDYGVNGVGDPLNLAPYDQVNNPGGLKNPLNIPLPEIPAGLDVPPAVIAENIGGYYVQPSPAAPSGATEGVANTVAAKNGFALRQYAPGGAELATNAAYNAAVIAGSVVLEIILPKNQ